MHFHLISKVWTKLHHHWMCSAIRIKRIVLCLSNSRKVSLSQPSLITGWVNADALTLFSSAPSLMTSWWHNHSGPTGCLNLPRPPPSQYEMINETFTVSDLRLINSAIIAIIILVIAPCQQSALVWQQHQFQKVQVLGPRCHRYYVIYCLHREWIELFQDHFLFHSFFLLENIVSSGGILFTS